MVIRTNKGCAGQPRQTREKKHAPIRNDEDELCRAKRILKQCLNMKEYDRVAEYIEQSAGSAEKDAELMELAAEAYYGLGEYNKAEKWANGAMKLLELGDYQQSEALARKKKKRLWHWSSAVFFVFLCVQKHKERHGQF